MLTLLPWQKKQWQQLQLAKKSDHMPHALLFTGPKGIGLSQFSECLAANLLCEAPGNDAPACGHCKACHLLKAENHPDLYLIEPEEEGKQIKVEQIRNLINFINLKSQYGQYKIVIINPAEAMNRSAANTLLKTLEEPPAQSLLILASHQSNLLPITIRSRCQLLRFHPVFTDEAVNWLSGQISQLKLEGPELNDLGQNEPEQVKHLLTAVQGAPLAALALLEKGLKGKRDLILDNLEQLKEGQIEPVEIASQWNELGGIQVFQWLLQLINEMAHLKLAVPGNVPREKGDVTRLQRLINELDLRELTQFYDLALKNYAMSMSSVSYNTQGLLEDFVVFWLQLSNKREGN